jgi:hypothetical protein
MTLSIHESQHKKLYHYGQCHFAERRIFFVVMLSVIVPSVIMPNVIVLSVLMLSVLSVNAVMFSVILLSVVAPFQPTMILNSKAGFLPSGEHNKTSSKPHPQILFRLKGFLGTYTLAYLSTWPQTKKKRKVL